MDELVHPLRVEGAPELEAQVPGGLFVEEPVPEAAPAEVESRRLLDDRRQEGEDQQEEIQAGTHVEAKRPDDGAREKRVPGGDLYPEAHVRPFRCSTYSRFKNRGRSDGL